MARKSGKRPDFGEMLAALEDEFRGKLRPPLEGYVYRFTIFLPLLCEGKEVFTGHQKSRLARLFHQCFGGYSSTSPEGYPPWYGSWAPPGTSQPVIDKHILMAIYTPQVEEAKDFFRHLRWILQQKQVADQDVVLIEHATVWLVETAEFPRSK